MSKSSKKSDIKSRISHSTAVPRSKAQVKKLPKEDVAAQYTEAVLKASKSATANISKTPRGKCMLVKFSDIDDYDVTVFVFGQDCIIVSAVDISGNSPLFDTMKRTFDSVENAAKFTRLAFIKCRQEAAKAVPTKPLRTTQSAGTDNNQVEA